MWFVMMRKNKKAFIVQTCRHKSEAIRTMKNYYNWNKLEDVSYFVTNKIKVG